MKLRELISEGPIAQGIGNVARSAGIAAGKTANVAGEVGSRVIKAIAGEPVNTRSTASTDDSVLSGVNVRLIKAGLTGVINGQVLAPQQIEEFKKLLANLG